LDDLSESDIKEINYISKRVRSYLTKGANISDKLDADIERMVAKIIGLRKKDYEIVYAVLNSIQDLLPVKALKNIGISEIFKDGA
jgi:L-rhamnose isomerase